MKLGYKVTPSRWDKFCLFFLRSHYSVSMGEYSDDPTCVVRFKIFRSTIFIMDEFSL